MPKILPKTFYTKDAALVARELLGKVLVRKFGKQELAGKIVETEAYYGCFDPASRAYSGKKTKLSEPMWAQAGTVFVYMVHSNWLLNIVTGKKEEPAAVLIRALEPLEGIGDMAKHRGIPADKLRGLTSGPGKLTKALRITNQHTGLNVTDPRSELWVEEGEKAKFKIARSHRIGVTRDLPRKLRFFIFGNRFVSK